MKNAFVIGDPIAHSKSPLIHGYWIDHYGVSGRYEAIEMPSAGIEDFMTRLKAGAFVGGNVTIPHKQAVMAFCDEIDQQARAIGAVNTLIVVNGRILGSNTDHFGFAANLDNASPGWDNGLKAAIVLGAGGAARAVLAALLARNLDAIYLLNRTLARAQDLAQAFGPKIVPGTLDDFARHAPGAGLVVNTTAVGMGGTAFVDIALEALPKDAVVNDIVYTPLVTPLLARADALGLQTVDGLGMLLYQAAPGFAAWFGVTPDVTPDLRRMVIEKMEN